MGNTNQIASEAMMLSDLCQHLLQKNRTNIPALEDVEDFVVTSKKRCKFLVDKRQKFKVGDMVYIANHGTYYISCIRRHDNAYIYATKTR